MRHRYLTLLLSIFLLSIHTNAQTADLDTSYKAPKMFTRKFYLSAGFDLGLLSTSVFQKPGSKSELTTPRFSSFFNFSVGANYDFDEHFGIFSGLNLKNIGMIEKDGDLTIKRRVYTIGAPLGLRLGTLNRAYGFLGGGVDVPFNYREKSFVHRSDKQKFNEWFSDRTPHLLPYLFAGAKFKSGFLWKIQYYPANFFNVDYVSNGKYIYNGYSAYLLYLSIGLDIPVHKNVITKDEDIN